jgi:uncharacterized phage protein (TIGR02218 family)
VRNVPGPVSAALATGLIPVAVIELYDITLLGGAQFHWSTFDRDFDWNTFRYLAQNPFLNRSKWTLSNTMKSIPTMTVTLLSLNDGFNGGTDIRSQIAQGLFDGAEFRMSELYKDMRDLSDLGSIDDVFGGVVAPSTVSGAKAVIEIKGANNKLDQNAPRRVYQTSCNNTFCDPGCTLLRASFTASYVVGASPTRSFIPWASAPISPELYQLGTVIMTSGAASGQSMNVDFADSSGLVLSYPLYSTPAPGDTFDAFEGCNKTQVRCNSRGNTQNGLWFKYVPPAETAV